MNTSFSLKFTIQFTKGEGRDYFSTNAALQTP